MQNYSPTAGTIVTGMLEAEARKRYEIAILQVESETLEARRSQQFLIDYWLEIGKCRRERKVEGDPGSRWVYYFVSDARDNELSLDGSWVKFFEVFDALNLFIQFFALDEPAYDPWNDPQWIQFDINDGEHPKQIYRVMEQLK